MSEPDDDRRAALLDASLGVFLRYGFKKTSMDLVARAAGLSRQGLYLHFPTKEVLFRETVKHFIASGRELGKRALADEERTAEERIVAAFAALHGHAADSEHLDELTATAAPILGSLIEEFEKGFVADLARMLQSSGVAARWQSADISAKALADHLYTVSEGLKRRGVARAAWLDRIKIAAKIVCRGPRG